MEQDISGISLERIVNYDETEKQIQRMTCPICLQILWKPVTCGECLKSYCDYCITRWITSNGMKCPNRCSFFKLKASPYVKECLSDFQIRCKYAVYGCENVLGYDQLEAHESSCKKECKFCGEVQVIHQLHEHEEACGMAKILCEKCNEEYSKTILKSHSEIECLSKLNFRLKNTHEESIREMEMLMKAIHDLKLENKTLKTLNIHYEDILDRIHNISNKKNIKFEDFKDAQSYENFSYRTTQNQIADCQPIERIMHHIQQETL